VGSVSQYFLSASFPNMYYGQGTPNTAYRFTPNSKIYFCSGSTNSGNVADIECTIHSFYYWFTYFPDKKTSMQFLLGLNRK